MRRKAGSDCEKEFENERCLKKQGVGADLACDHCQIVQSGGGWRREERRGRNSMYLEVCMV